MKISLPKTMFAALAALLLTAASASAASSTAQHITSPAAAKKQLKTIAAAENLWKDEFVARWDAGQTPQPSLLAFDPSRTYFAVTDLDGNGRLELLFRHADVPKGTAEPVPPLLTHVPTRFGMTVYEIGTNGRLARLPVTEDGSGAPDLTDLSGLHHVNADGTRPYNLCTRTLSEGDDGHYHYTIAYQQFILKNGVVTVDLCAEENGFYRLHGDRIEEVPTSANIYDGDPAHLGMRHEDFIQSTFYRDFGHVYTPPSSVHWMSGDELNRDPREALAASWAGFVYGVMDGKG